MRDIQLEILIFIIIVEHFFCLVVYPIKAHG